MNKFIQKNVDSGLLPEKVGEYIEEAIKNGESIIVAGHRSTGIRPLFAALSGAAKLESGSAVQVRGEDSFEKDGKYYLIPGNPKVDLGELVLKAVEKPDAAFVTVKDPEQPISLQKILRQNKKNGGPTDKVFHEIALRKDGVGAGATPFTDKVTKFFYNEKGRVKREQLDF